MRSLLYRLSSPAPIVSILIAVAFNCPGNVFAADTETDSALWAGGLFYFETTGKLDFSTEYQLRLGEHMSSVSSQFGEFLGYYRAHDYLLLNGGYRYTRRPGRSEHRLYLGGFWNITKNPRRIANESGKTRAVLQFGYQHDFDVKFDDQLMDSDSIRFVLVVSKPANEKWIPFLVGGVLTTWNDAYSFGVDKIRLGGGIEYRLSTNSRVRGQYMWEKARFRTPEKRTNIFWIRYEMKFGKRAWNPVNSTTP